MPFPLSPQFTNGESLDAVLLNARITDKLNDLYALASATATMRVQASSATINVTDSNAYNLTYYNDGVTYDQDPLSLISYSTGVFTVAAAGLWGWEITVEWPSVLSSVGAHHRDAYVRRNGTAQAAGRVQIPYAGGVAWPTISQMATGQNSLGIGDTMDATFYQNSGGTLTATGASFAMWLIALS